MVILPTGEPSAVTSKKTLAVDMIASRQISETLAGDGMILVKFTFGSFLNPPIKLRVTRGHSKSQIWSIDGNIQFLTRPTKVGRQGQPRWTKFGR